MTEPRNERIPDELESEVEDGRDEADQSDGLEMDSSWESMLDKRFADMADEQVVGLAQQGDSVAVEYLLSKYKNFVRSKARSYFLIGADHEDIVQEGMIGLFKAIRDYQAERLSSFRAFAELCITRQIITAIKTATRQKHVPLNSYVSLNKPIYDEESDRTLMDVIVEGRAQNPEELIIGRENLVSFRDQVDRVLSGLEQDVLNAYLDGKSYQEIADKLGRHVKSIDNALQRVKRKMEKFLEEAKSQDDYGAPRPPERSPRFAQRDYRSSKQHHASWRPCCARRGLRADCSGGTVLVFAADGDHRLAQLSLVPARQAAGQKTPEAAAGRGLCGRDGGHRGRRGAQAGTGAARTPRGHAGHAAYQRPVRAGGGRGPAASVVPL